MTIQIRNTLDGRISRIRPSVPEDLEFLYTISACEQNGFRWRYRGEFPDPSSFARDHDEGTLLQLIVMSIQSNERAGIVNLYSQNLRDGWAYLGALSAPEFQTTGIVVDGAATLLDYAFNLWPFRKIYLETIEYNLSEFETGLKRFSVEESRLREHVFFGDRYWDVVTSAVYRDTWRLYRRSSAESISNPTASGVGFDEFKGILRHQLEISIDSPERVLVSDLGIDSLQMAELLVTVCDLAGAPDPDELPVLVTVGDLFQWYLSMCQAPREV
ncbi:MAG: hypothetical protein E6R05_01510 [Candidatus Moraniibacteriota bacterium]|nr:MAG: hypothetical protein E6R05_01510 [Candidatus Moranbacteria bacterium]